MGECVRPKVIRMHRQATAYFFLVLLCCQSVTPRPSQEKREALQFVARQDSGNFGLAEIIHIGSKIIPIILEAVSSTSNDVNRIDDVDVKDEADAFSWQKMISLGVKIVLTLLSDSATDPIDKSDNSPMQAVVGTVISALTGSENPQEVATMAKQASEAKPLADSASFGMLRILAPFD